MVRSFITFNGIFMGYGATLVMAVELGISGLIDEEE